ncbi:MAG: cation:proton antiporter [Methanosarcinaceae archaeon]|nr:cation:proton antiporter [Methanosarcinaceae archaeon]
MISLAEADFLALVVLVLATAPCIYRVLYGPTLPDRIVAEDALGNALVVIFGLYAYREGSIFLIDVAMLLAIISFVGTIVLAKYLDKGKVL